MNKGLYGDKNKMIFVSVEGIYVPFHKISDWFKVIYTCSYNDAKP